MNNLWKKEGVPHKGWSLQSVIDIREDGQSVDETSYETCMMCNNERIRYVHIISHSEIEEEYRVGCICAEKMTNDYKNPKQREKHLKNRANRRTNWLKKEWEINSNGNFYRKYQGHYILIYKDKKTSKFRIKINDTFGKKYFDKSKEAKVAAFNGIEYFKEKGQ